MYTLTLYTLLCVTAAYTSAFRLPFIIGGRDVTDNTRWPSMGSLLRFEGHYCGCSMISENWALTAAHCISGPPSFYSIRFGSTVHHRNGTIVSVNTMIVHERYQEGPGYYPNDIAVVRFNTVNFTDSVQPIRLAVTSHVENEDCWITGWGWTITGGPGQLSSVLQEANVQVYDNITCKEIYEDDLIDGMLCVGDAVNGRGACHADSGGPLMCKSAEEEEYYELVGLTSWGPEGCYTDFPTVYTSVPYFLDWVTEHTGVGPVLL